MKVYGWTLYLPSGKIEFNEGKAKNLGYDPEEERFKHYTGFTDLIHPDDYEPTMDAMRDYLKDKTPMYSYEYRIRDSEGNYHKYKDSGVILHKKDGETVLYGATIDNT